MAPFGPVESVSPDRQSWSGVGFHDATAARCSGWTTSTSTFSSPFLIRTCVRRRRWRDLSGPAVPSGKLDCASTVESCGLRMGVQLSLTMNLISSPLTPHGRSPFQMPTFPANTTSGTPEQMCPICGSCHNPFKSLHLRVLCHARHIVCISRAALPITATSTSYSKVNSPVAGF